MQVVPGSHKRGLHNHFNEDGEFPLCQGDLRPLVLL